MQCAAPLPLDADLESQGDAGRIGLSQRGMADQAAEINKMLLGSRALFQGHVPPLGDELLGREGRPQGLQIPWGTARTSDRCVAQRLAPVPT